MGLQDYPKCQYLDSLVIDQYLWANKQLMFNFMQHFLDYKKVLLEFSPCIVPKCDCGWVLTNTMVSPEF